MKIEKEYSHFFEALKEISDINDIINWQETSELKGAKKFFSHINILPNMPPIDKHMQEIIEELSGMEIPMILMGDPKQDLKGFKCLRNLMSIYEQNVRYISECHRCPQLHLELSNRLVDKNEKQKSEKDSGQLSVYYESEIDCHTLIERQKYDLMYISQKQGVYETHDYKKNNIRENLAEELEPLLFENHPTKDAQTVKKVAYYYAGKMIEKYRSTYSGHTLACAAGVAAMKYYKEHDIEGHVAEMHEIVAPFMDEMVKKHKCIGEARCIGLFGALEVVKNKETREPMQEYGVPGPVMPWIFAELKKRGFATFGRENFIEICPPLIITKEELEEYLPILDEVLTMVDEKFCD